MGKNPLGKINFVQYEGTSPPFAYGAVSKQTSLKKWIETNGVPRDPAEESQSPTKPPERKGSRIEVDSAPIPKRPTKEMDGDDKKRKAISHPSNKAHPPKKTKLEEECAPDEAVVSIPQQYRKRVPYVVPTSRAELFRQFMPEPNILIKMKNLAQGSLAWRIWREQNLTVGASSMGALLGLSDYDTPLKLMEKLMGKFKEERSETVYTMIGHLMESICSSLFILSIRKSFKIKDCVHREIGVIYREPWGTASLDGVLDGDFLVFVAEVHDGKFFARAPRPTDKPEAIRKISLRKCITEFKCPSRKRYKFPCNDHLVQMMWQLMACMVQHSDSELLEKKYAFLSHLYAPFNLLENEENGEMFTLRPEVPWIKKTWLVKYHQPLCDWMTERIEVFKAGYEEVVKDPENGAKIIRDLPPFVKTMKDPATKRDVIKQLSCEFLKKGGGTIPPEVMPIIIELPEQKFFYKGEEQVFLRSSESKEEFLDRASFSSNDDTEYKYTTFHHWKNLRCDQKK